MDLGSSIVDDVEKLFALQQSKTSSVRSILSTHNVSRKVNRRYKTAQVMPFQPGLPTLCHIWLC